MSFRVKSLKGLIWNHFARLLDYGLAYFLSVLFARRLGATDYGVYVTMMGIASFILIIGGVGLDETLNKFISQLYSEQKFDEIRFVTSRLLVLRVMVMMLLCFAIFLLRSPLSVLFHNEQVAQYVSVLVFYIFSQGLVNFFSNIYTAQLRTYYVLVINVAGKILNIGISLFLLSMQYKLTSIFFLFSVVSFLSLAVYVFGVRKSVAGKQSSVVMRPIYNFTLVTWFNAFLALALGRYSDILLLGFFLGTTAQTGFYDVAFSLTTLVDYTFTVGLVGVWLSVISELALKNQSRLAGMRARLIQYQQFFIFPAGFFCLLYPERIITIFFSTKYLSAVPLFRVYLSFLLLSIFFGNRENLGFLLAIGKQNVAIFSRTVIGCINVVLNWFIIPKYGAIGAIFSTGFCALVSNGVEFMIASHFIGKQYNAVFTLKVLLVTLTCLGITSFIPVHSFSAFAMNGISYLIFIIVGYQLLKVFDFSPRALEKSLGM